MPSNPIHVGLIGAGRWGKVYIRTLASLQPRCRLTHLCTSNPANAQLAPYPVVVVGSWDELLRSACDAVIIATPPHTHAEILEACLDAGKPCIVEKPLCLDVASAVRLHRRIEAADALVLVDHTYLFHPGYRALRDALRASQEPIRVIVSEGGGLGPFRAHTPALWDWCPHDFSLCLDLVGERPRHIRVLRGPHDPDDQPELVGVRLDFPGGAGAWVQAGRLLPRKRRNLSVFTDHRLYLFDDRAAEPLLVAPIEFARRYAGGIPEEPRPARISPASELLPMASMVAYFLDGLRGGDRQYFGTALAVEVVRLLARCDAALGRGRRHVERVVWER